MKLKLVFLAKLRERFGAAEETLIVDSENPTVSDIINLLVARGGAWAEELSMDRSYRIAVNQKMGGFETIVADGDELAIFPPVTGG
jgi:molybdopterin synthase sulfur carrier subunit